MEIFLIFDFIYVKP